MLFRSAKPGHKAKDCTEPIIRGRTPVPKDIQRQYERFRPAGHSKEQEERRRARSSSRSRSRSEDPNRKRKKEDSSTSPEKPPTKKHVSYAEAAAASDSLNNSIYSPINRNGKGINQGNTPPDTKKDKTALIISTLKNALTDLKKLEKEFKFMQDRFKYHDERITNLEKTAGIKTVPRIISQEEFNHIQGNDADPDTPLDDMIIDQTGTATTKAQSPPYWPPSSSKQTKVNNATPNTKDSQIHSPTLKQQQQSTFSEHIPTITSEPPVSRQELDSFAGSFKRLEDSILAAIAATQEQ